MPPRDDESETHLVVDRLRRYVAVERDPWVLDRVAAALAEEMIEELTPVFRDLLGHPVPSVRYRAMQFFADDDSDLGPEDVQKLLERMWRAERTPWVRARLFDALAELKRDGKIAASRVSIRLRGTRYDHLFKAELERRDIADIVELVPPIGYEAALNEMLTADGLLIFQASNCNHQTPAKLYEYFRARRPVWCRSTVLASMKANTSRMV